MLEGLVWPQNLSFSYYKARHSSLCDSPLALRRPRLTVGLNDHQDHLFHPTWFCDTKGLHIGLYVYWQKHRENCTLDDSNCSCVSHSCCIDVTLVWRAAGKKRTICHKIGFLELTLKPHYLQLPLGITALFPNSTNNCYLLIKWNQRILKQIKNKHGMKI